MGTSKSYDAPTTPQWSDLKRKITTLAKEGRRLGSESAKQLVGQFVGANGGAQAIASVGARSAQAMARNLGGFIALISAVGFDEALTRTGLDHLRGMSTSDIILSLIDYFGDAASTIDQVDARNALSQLMSEMFNEAEDIDDIEKILEEYADSDNLTQLLEKFFAFYVFQQFCRSTYERLASKVGNSKADAFLNDILDFIKSEITVLTLDRDIAEVDWNGSEGESVCIQIMEKTLEVFGG